MQKPPRPAVIGVIAASVAPVAGLTFTDARKTPQQPTKEQHHDHEPCVGEGLGRLLRDVVADARE